MYLNYDTILYYQLNAKLDVSMSIDLILHLITNKDHYHPSIPMGKAIDCW